MKPHPPEVPLADRSPHLPPSHRRRVGGALVAWLALLLVATVTPGDPSMPTGPFLCFPCGDLGSADAILNVVLFVPAGLLLGALGVGLPGVALAGFGTSAAVEAIQFLLPGRFPTAADVVVNGLGALLGLALYRGRLAALGRAWGVAGATAVALFATTLLTRPVPPPGPLFGQHTPSLGGHPPYTGRVVDARVGDLVVPSWEVDDADALRDALAGGTVTVRFEVGRPPDDWAPVFAVFSGDQEEALFVAVRGDDVEVRFRSLAGALRFQRPAAVLPGGLAGVRAGETVTVSSRPTQAGRCIATPVGEGCGRGVDPTQGWRFLVDGDGWPPWMRLLASVLWVAVPAGLLVRAPDPARRRWAAGIVLLILAMILPTLDGPAAIRWEPLLGGVLLGGAVALGSRRWTGPASRVRRPADPLADFPSQGVQ